MLMKKSIQFGLLIIFMMLINLIGHLIGILFVGGYVKYEGHFHFFDMLILISIYSVFQIYIFPINKKYRVYIIPAFTLLLFLFLSYSNTDGFGGEIVYMVATLISKIITLFYFISDYITDDTIRINFVILLYSLGYSLYLLIVFLMFKSLLKYLTYFCKEKGFNIVLKMKKK